MQVAGTIAVVVSVLVLAFQAREVAGQSRIANQVAGTQSHREILFHWKSLVDVFIRYPQLHPYYYDKTTAAPSADDSVRLGVIADQHADFLEIGYITSRQLASYEHWIGEWNNYIPQQIESSSHLRSIIRSNPSGVALDLPARRDLDTAHPTA